MEIMQTNEMELHELTKTHPVMDDAQYSAFKLDIENNGQIQPVLLYRGRIVDGRHRLRALTELGIETIKTEKLANNLTLDKLKEIVNSTEVRRHQTPTMIAAKAYRLYVGGMKQADAATKAGSSLTNLKRVAQIANLGRNDIITTLEQGGKVNISSDGRFPMMSDSLLAIVNKIKDDNAFLMTALGVEDKEPEESKISREQVVLVNSLATAASVLDAKAKKMLIAKLYEAIDAN